MAALAPEISIIMATYNRADLIGETLDSIICQSFTNWECLIIDDGSTDNTPKVLKRYLKDERMFYHNRSSEYSKGCPGSRNQGLSLARGKYVLFFDDDDIAHPDLLNLCFEQLESQSIDFCRFKREVFYDNLEINFDRRMEFSSFKVNEKDLEAIITNKLPFNSCQVIWKTSCFRPQGFKEEILYADDWERYSRLISSGISGVSINKVLLYARKHRGSSTAKFQRKNDKIFSATKLANIHVIDNLIEKERMNDSLFRFFVRRSLLMKDYPSLNHLLKRTNSSPLKKMKLRMGYYIYPLLKPFFQIKKIFLN